ncbi:carbon monoxide dehydrogenase, partial [Rhodobacterales bacterium HKCCSP123]|nr:carbon monoxide dehydrogenase [Rhodobacterales bacterium HKCCSP123]
MQVTRFPSRAEGLVDRMVGFVAHLRMNGIALGPGETADALAALAAVNSTDPVEARMALAALLVPDAEGWRRFDELFDAYWFNAGKTRAGKAQAHVRKQLAQPKLWQPHLDTAPDAGEGAEDSTTPGGTEEDEAEGTEGRLIATRARNLTKRDLRELMDADSLRAAEAAALKLARAIRD